MFLKIIINLNFSTFYPNLSIEIFCIPDENQVLILVFRLQHNLCEFRTHKLKRSLKISDLKIQIRLRFGMANAIIPILG